MVAAVFETFPAFCFDFDFVTDLPISLFKKAKSKVLFGLSVLSLSVLMLEYLLFMLAMVLFLVLWGTRTTLAAVVWFLRLLLVLLLIELLLVCELKICLLLKRQL